MSISDRISLYQAIESLRQRPLIVYATSTRQNHQALIQSDVVREFIDQIDAVPASERSIDVLLHSNGGDGLASWKAMSLLRERFDTIGVLVPAAAFSAATIFALGADEIVMHPHASLGPIDPQIIVTHPDGTQRRFATEDVRAFLRFLEDEARLTDQSATATLIERLLSTVDPLHVGTAMRASHLSTDIGARMLTMHMRGEGDAEKAKGIAEQLNKSFFAHGDAVSRTGHAT